MTECGTTPALEVRGLVHRYEAAGRSRLALDGVDLEVGAGEFVSLVGPSGCGKTTLLRAAAGLLRPRAGGVRTLGTTPRAACAARRLGLVAQDPGLLPWRTVSGNVALALQLGDSGAPIAPRVEQLLARVGLAGFGDYHPRALSGGMRQRVALARALAHRPQLLLMDEPFGALDELSREELRRELIRLWERDRVSVLFVTHSIREAVLLSDRVVVMTRAPGRIAASLPIELPRPRSDDLEETPEFHEHLRAVRSSLAGGASRAA